jgi:hypothetical protein
MEVEHNETQSKKRKRSKMTKDEKNRKRRERRTGKEENKKQQEYRAKIAAEMSSPEAKVEINKKQQEYRAKIAAEMSPEANEEKNKKQQKYRAKVAANMSPEAKIEINKKQQEYRENIGPAVINKKKQQYRAKVAAEMSPEAKEQKKKEQQEDRAKQKVERKKKKSFNHKGFVSDEKDWLVTHKFVECETVKEVSDWKDRDKIGRHYLGEMQYKCRYCGALGFRGEIQGENKNPNWVGKEKDPNEYDKKLVHFGSLCCNKGKVEGVGNYNLPEELEQLYTSVDDDLALHFRENSRTYNNGMAMCSVTAKGGWKSRTPNNKQESMLTANGQLFRRIGSLLPRDGEQPKCVQTYFYGGDEATKWRIKNTRKKIPSLKERNTYTNVFKQLHTILVEKADNKYIKEFVGVKDYVEKNLKGKVWDVKLSIHGNQSVAGSTAHRGQLNAPTVNEVAILMPSEESITAEHKRCVVMNYKQRPGEKDKLQFIPDYHKSYDPWMYPLIFPDGQDGWHYELDHTCLQHMNYQLMKREGIVNPILLGRGLGQQYIVDQYAKIELGRLRYVAKNQKEMRVELYSGAKDAMKKSDTDLNNVGRKVILPSSFTGGDRYMHQQYLDAIALYQTFGHPHLFITMTCNPDWPEIKDNLEPGQTALDQPDLVQRVFNLKKRQLIKDLEIEMIFGRFKARTHSIEFQKRGFPHMHIIVWLDREKHSFTPEELDKIICAEIPDEFLDDKGKKVSKNVLYCN